MSRRKAQSNPKVAVAYIRMSTDEQRNSPEAQRQAIASWAAQQGVRIALWCQDAGVSGAAPLEEREGLLQALGALREHGAGLLVVAKRDRLARDVSMAAAIERLTREAGAQIVTADGLDASDTPEAALVRTIIDAMAQYERALIRARTRAALKVKKQRGERVGSVPFGFVANANGQLVPHAAEQAAIQRTRELHAEGLTQQEIAQRLGLEGHAARGARWHATTISRILRAA